MSVGDAGDHQNFEPKLLNISRRFASNSCAEGATPYFAHVPYPVSKGCPALPCAGSPANVISRIRLTKRSGETTLRDCLCVEGYANIVRKFDGQIHFEFLNCVK